MHITINKKNLKKESNNIKTKNFTQYLFLKKNFKNSKIEINYDKNIREIFIFFIFNFLKNLQRLFNLIFFQYLKCLIDL